MLISQEGPCFTVLLSFIFATISLDNFLTVQSPGESTFRYIFRKNKYYSEGIRRYMFASLAVICLNITRAVLQPLSSFPLNGDRKKSSEQRHRGRHFTCGNYLKDTGRSLGADGILSPAGQRAVIQFRHRGVPQDARGAIASGSEPLRRDLQGLPRVVELPLEASCGRVCLHFTSNV